MGPIGHSAISTGIGAGVWGVTGSPVAGGAALGVGVLTDVDHLFDFYQWYVRRKQGKLFLFFHAWEYGIAGLLALLFLFYDPIFLAIVLAHLGHVATDQFHNGLNTRSYFITYRALIRFDAVRITGNDNVHYAYTVWPGLLPFGERLRPWYEGKIEPWFRSRLND